MFKSVRPLGKTKFERGLYYYKYSIVDSKFKEDWDGPCDQSFLWYQEVRATGAIIACYWDKKLDVALNLALYHKYMENTFDWYRIKDEIQYNIDHVPGYKYYSNEVAKSLERFNNLTVFE